MQEQNKTYDIIFNNEESSSNKGFKESLDFCKNYIAQHNGTSESYFADYKGGTVQIVCNETEEVVFETPIDLYRAAIVKHSKAVLETYDPVVIKEFTSINDAIAYFEKEYADMDTPTAEYDVFAKDEKGNYTESVW